MIQIFAIYQLAEYWVYVIRIFFDTCILYIGFRIYDFPTLVISSTVIIRVKLKIYSLRRGITPVYIKV